MYLQISKNKVVGSAMGGPRELGEFFNEVASVTVYYFDEKKTEDKKKNSNPNEVAEPESEFAEIKRMDEKKKKSSPCCKKKKAMKAGPRKRSAGAAVMHHSHETPQLQNHIGMVVSALDEYMSKKGIIKDEKHHTCGEIVKRLEEASKEWGFTNCTKLVKEGWLKPHNMGKYMPEFIIPQLADVGIMTNTKDKRPSKKYLFKRV